MVIGLAVLLFQGLAASPSLCRSLLGARAVSPSPRAQNQVLKQHLANLRRKDLLSRLRNDH